MNKSVLAFLTCLVTTSCAMAEVSVLNSGEKSGQKVSDVKFGECHIRLSDPFKGKLHQSSPASTGFTYHGPLLHAPRRPNDVAVQMWCEKSSDELFRDCAINLKDGKLNTTNTEGETEDVIRLLNQQRVILTGKNWNGAGYTEDQITGEEDLRTRSFHFCAVNGDKTIYGRAESVAWLNNLKESAMPNIIKLLEGIEFIND